MSLEEDVRAFHHKMGYAVNDSADLQDRALRRRMVAEEARELIDAINLDDPAHIAQEAVDLAYVCVGVCVSYGLPFEKAWDIIHEANMSKTPVPDYGKPLKPPGWKSPLSRIRRLLFG